MHDENGLSEDEGSISWSDVLDTQDEEKRDEEEEEEAPLIHLLRTSFKLRWLKISRNENRGEAEEFLLSRISGAKCIMLG